jgi:hypothetical protein
VNDRHADPEPALTLDLRGLHVEIERAEDGPVLLAGNEGAQVEFVTGANGDNRAAVAGAQRLAVTRRRSLRSSTP